MQDEKFAKSTNFAQPDKATSPDAIPLFHARVCLTIKTNEAITYDHEYWGDLGPVMISKKVGFVGAGNMATALARGFLQRGLVAAQNISASDPASAARERFAQELPGAKVHAHNSDVVAEAEVLFLAVKPQVCQHVLRELKEHAAHPENILFVSMMAGIRLKVLRETLGSNSRLIRMMPNAPCLEGEGAIGYCASETAKPEDRELIQRLLESVGIVHELSEELLDAVTGLSGSGPAFAFLIAEALSDGGTLMGLPRGVATQLAAQTLRGAATMILNTQQPFSSLKEQVTSPGGTTIHGLRILEQHGVRGALIEAVQAATRRSKELAG